jgi:hypothetical protein
VLQLTFNWKVLSAIAGLTVWNFSCRLYPGTIKSPQLVDFLRRLGRQLDRKLLIIWGGLAAHRRRRVLTYGESTQGHIPARTPPSVRAGTQPRGMCGAMASSMSCQTFVRRILLISATWPEADCAAGNDAGDW